MLLTSTHLFIAFNHSDGEKLTLSPTLQFKF